MRSKIYLFKEVKRDRLSSLAARNAKKNIAELVTGCKLLEIAVVEGGM